MIAYSACGQPPRNGIRSSWQATDVPRRKLSRQFYKIGVVVGQLPQLKKAATEVTAFQRKRNLEILSVFRNYFPNVADNFSGQIIGGGQRIRF